MTCGYQVAFHLRLRSHFICALTRVKRLARPPPPREDCSTLRDTARRSRFRRAPSPYQRQPDVIG